MLKDNTYRINDSQAMSETLDDETIIINLENGNYYSMNKTGSLIWNKIIAGYSTFQITTYFSSIYDEAADIIEKSVLKIIDFLKKDQLILEAETNNIEESEAVNGSKGKFIIPTIERYEDMQEMLLADPIHDVEEIGWPRVKSA